MTPRRTLKRQMHRSHTLRYMVLFLALALPLAILTTLVHTMGWLAGTAVIATVAYAIGRRHEQPKNAPRASVNARYDATTEVVSSYPREVGDARTRANGWTAPTRSRLLSRECAGASTLQSPEHGFCHDPRCSCECQHVSQRKPLVRIPAPDAPPF
jgi:hypothetical protein